jgi:hypothetical protein
MAEKKVVLEFVDKATECVMHDVVVEGEALSDLERLAGEEGGSSLVAWSSSWMMTVSSISFVVLRAAICPG